MSSDDSPLLLHIPAVFPLFMTQYSLSFDVFISLLNNYHRLNIVLSINRKIIFEN